MPTAGYRTARGWLSNFMLQLIPIPAISEGIFWMLFSMNVVFLLISYIPMFPAFLKMRKVDPNRKRVFTFPFKGKLMYVMLAIPAIELVLAIIATIVPLNGSEEELSKIPMLIGVIVFVVLGEVVRIWSKRCASSAPDARLGRRALG